MATTRLYLDFLGKARDGKGSVIIILTHNRTTASISTGIRLSGKEWSKGRAVKTHGADAINAKLNALKSDIDTKIAILSLDASFDTMTATDLKKSVEADKPKHEERTVSDLFNEYISNGMSSGTETIYRTTLSKVLDFSGNIRMSDINLKWLYQFEKHLAKTQGVNGRGIYLRSLRAVCLYSMRTKVINESPFDNYKFKTEPTRKRSATVEKLREFRDFPVSKATEAYRDYFFLMFYLIGINSVDLFNAKKSAVVNGRLEYVRQKTHKKYSIKIEPEAQAIIDKHNGKGEYLLAVRDTYSNYKDFIHHMNAALKKIGPYVIETETNPDDLFDQTEVKKVSPIIPGVSTYYARHSWATLAYENDIPVDTISQALGHSDGNRTTLIYIKFDQKKIDEANRKVIDCLNGK